MNPLLHGDLHRYVKDLVDHHLPEEDGEARSSDGEAERKSRVLNDERPSTVKKETTA